jgi:hypothetical protein
MPLAQSQPFHDEELAAADACLLVQRGCSRVARFYALAGQKSAENQHHGRTVRQLVSTPAPNQTKVPIDFRKRLRVGSCFDYTGVSGSQGNFPALPIASQT